MAGIFKAYDVRGKFPEEINKEIASKTAYALAKLNNPKKVLITVDVRQGSEAVKDGLIQGFLNFNPDISISISNTLEILIASLLQIFIGSPGFPFSNNFIIAATPSRTSMKSREVSKLPT